MFYTDYDVGNFCFAHFVQKFFEKVYEVNTEARRMKVKARRCLLVDLLRERGWTQQDLANRTGYDRRRISQWATNERRMNIDNSATIANVLGVDPRELYEWHPVSVKSTKKEARD
jgi:lambda repressor-like predicted transcriptional regulator